MEVLAERIVMESAPESTLIPNIGMTVSLAVIILSALIGAFSFERNSENVCIFTFLLGCAMFLGFLAWFIINAGHQTEVTEYLVKINNDTSYTDFCRKYEISEKLSDTLYWCKELNGMGKQTCYSTQRRASED